MLPVIFIHGLVGPFANPRTIAHLGAATILCPDMLGYGAEAAADPDTLTIDAQVDYLRATIDEPHVHLIGHSIGGVIGATYAHRYQIGRAHV